MNRTSTDQAAEDQTNAWYERHGLDLPVTGMFADMAEDNDHDDARYENDHHDALIENDHRASLNKA